MTYELGECPLCGMASPDTDLCLIKASSGFGCTRRRGHGGFHIAHSHSTSGEHVQGLCWYEGHGEPWTPDQPPVFVPAGASTPPTEDERWLVGVGIVPGAKCDGLAALYSDGSWKWVRHGDYSDAACQQRTDLLTMLTEGRADR